MNSLKSRESPYSLSFAVDYFLQSYRPLRTRSPLARQPWNT